MPPTLTLSPNFLGGWCVWQVVSLRNVQSRLISDAFCRKERSIFVDRNIFLLNVIFLLWSLLTISKESFFKVAIQVGFNRVILTFAPPNTIPSKTFIFEENPRLSFFFDFASKSKSTLEEEERIGVEKFSRIPLSLPSLPSRMSHGRMSEVSIESWVRQVRK